MTDADEPEQHQAKTPINFDPDEFARPSKGLQVSLFRDVTQGIDLDAREWITQQRLRELHRLRNKLRLESSSAFVCACCRLPLIMRQHPSDGGHHFVHRSASDAEALHCEFRQHRQTDLNTVDRIRYHGMREGARHIRTKELILRILNSDPRFEGTAVEQTWRSYTDGWRKPDVAARWCGRPVVFEAQVSNTYPHVVAERTRFYREAGAVLIWVFDALPSAWRTLHADTFCSNEQHMFLVDEEVADHSTRRDAAYFRVVSLQPDVRPVKSGRGHHVLELAELQEDVWRPFDQLRLDPQAQTACRFNASIEAWRAAHKVLCANTQAQIPGARQALATALKHELGVTRVSQSGLEGWAALVCAIESCRLNVPIGTRFSPNNRRGVCHLVYDNHPSFLPLLVAALTRLGLDRDDQCSRQWVQRMRDYNEGRYRGGPLPAAHPKAGELLNRLYDGLEDDTLI